MRFPYVPAARKLVVKVSIKLVESNGVRMLGRFHLLWVRALRLQPQWSHCAWDSGKTRQRCCCCSGNEDNNECFSPNINNDNIKFSQIDPSLLLSFRGVIATGLFHYRTLEDEWNLLVGKLELKQYLFARAFLIVLSKSEFETGLDLRSWKAYGCILTCTL